MTYDYSLNPPRESTGPNWHVWALTAQGRGAVTYSAVDPWGGHLVPLFVIYVAF